MIRSTCIWIGWMWLMARIVGAAEDPRQPFQWRKMIEHPVESGTLYRIRTTPDVFDACPSFPADVRLFDAQGRAWPFFLWAPAGREEVRQVPAELLNAGQVEQPARYLRQDLRVRSSRAGGARPIHDRVVIRMSGETFFRRVEVLGSETGETWIALAEGYLVAQGRDGADNRTISYPASDFPLVQVRIHPDARNTSEPMALREISLARLLSETGERETLPLEWTVPSAEQRKDTQVLLADAGARNRPLIRIGIEAGEGDYARPVRVHGRNAPTNDWRWVAEGGVHRIGAHMRDTVEVRGAAYRYWKIELLQGEDAPLAIRRLRAEAVPQDLVFEARGGPETRPALYFGTSRFGLPRFDLQQRTPAEARATAPIVELGRRHANPERVVHGLSRYGRVFGLAAVALVSLLVIAVIAHMIRRRTSA